MFNAPRHTLIVLITTLSFTGQVLSFDQPVSVADVKIHPGYYEGNWVTIEGTRKGVGSLFLDSLTILSVEIPPCRAAHALPLETSPIMC